MLVGPVQDGLVITRQKVKTRGFELLAYQIQLLDHVIQSRLRNGITANKPRSDFVTAPFAFLFETGEHLDILGIGNALGSQGGKIPRWQTAAIAKDQVFRPQLLAA